MEFPWCENYCSRFLRFLDFVPHVFTVSAPFIAERWCGSRSFGEAWGTRLLYAGNSSISRRRNFLASPRSGIWKKTYRAVRSNERGGGADWICQGIGAYLRAHFEDRISVIEFFSLCERLGCEEDLKKVFSFQDVPTSLAVDIVGEGLRKMISRWAHLLRLLFGDEEFLSRDENCASSSPGWYNLACVRFSGCKTCSVRHDTD